MKAATVRRLVNVSASRQERVRRVVEYMDRVEGWGWKRRMEVRDRVMDQDHPTSWLSGRKLVSRVFLDKLEAYAARFGFVPHVAVVERELPRVRRALDSLLA